MKWFPHSTVATVVERDGRFLMVEERDADRRVFNQPAGHLEPGETLFEAARRETLEESGWEVELSHFLGLYFYVTPQGSTYIRHCFIAKALRQREDLALDPEIIAAHWLAPEQILAPDFPARSPAVRRVLEDYRRGLRYPLDLIYHQFEE